MIPDWITYRKEKRRENMIVKIFYLTGAICFMVGTIISMVRK